MTNAYDDTITAAVDRYGNLVTVDLVKAVIQVESGFHAQAYRAEPKYYCRQLKLTGDASYGLMQVLYCTAYALGYRRTPEGLYDPATNIDLGVRYLSSLARTKRGDLLSAISAYNNGVGDRMADGQFRNQVYVDKVLEALGSVVQTLPTVVITGRMGEAAPDGTWTTLALIAGALWLAKRFATPRKSV